MVATTSKKEVHMKKMIAILPLAVMLANCSTTRNTDNAVANSDMSVTTTSTTSTDMSNPNTQLAMSGAATVSPNDTWNNGNGSTNWGWDYGRTTGIYATSYDPNLRSDLDGEWTLAMSPDLGSSWLPDNSSSYTYTGLTAVPGTYTNGTTTTTTTDQTTTVGDASLENATVNTTGLVTKTKTKTTPNKSKTKTKTMKGSEVADPDLNATTSDVSTTTTSTTNTVNSANTYTSGSATVTPGTTWNTQALLAANGNYYMVPKLNLYIGNGSYTGFTGCNAINGRVRSNGNAISFENTMPSTAIDCMGGFNQQAFMERLGRVDSYEILNGQLLLKQGSTVLLTLNKTANP